MSIYFWQYSNSETGQATIVVHTKPDSADKPRDFVMTSCFVIMLCNFCWGIARWHYGRKYIMFECLLHKY